MTSKKNSCLWYVCWRLCSTVRFFYLSGFLLICTKSQFLSTSLSWWSIFPSWLFFISSYAFMLFSHILKWILGMNKSIYCLLHINALNWIWDIFTFLRNSLFLFTNFNQLSLILLIHFKPRWIFMLCKWHCRLFIAKRCLFIFILNTTCSWAFIESLYISSRSSTTSASGCFCRMSAKRLYFNFLDIKLRILIFEGKRVHFVMTAERVRWTHSMFDVWLVITGFSRKNSRMSFFIFKGAEMVRILERNFFLLLMFIKIVIFFKIMVSGLKNFWIALIKSLVRKCRFEFLWRFYLF